MQVDILPIDAGGPILGLINEAQSQYGNSIRADSKRASPVAVAGQRAMVRKTVVDTALMAERIGGRPRADENRLRQVVGVLGEALGLRAVDGRMDGMEARADSSYFPGELVARDSNPVRVADEMRAIQESVNSRNIDPAMQLYESNAIGYEGTAEFYKGPATKIPRADYNTGTINRQVHTIVTSTAMDWLGAIYGGASSINAAAEKAEAADRALKTSLEDVLAFGAPGTDLRGLFGANRLPGIAYYPSTLDYSSDATTLGAIYADFQKFAQAIRKANNYRGAGRGDTLLVAPQVMEAIAQKNNIDAGGELTGSELFLAIQQANAQIGSALRAAGITAVIEAPKLGTVPGPAGTETNLAGAVLFRRGNMQGLRRVIALAPSPARTAEKLLGSETLWVLRTGGLECPDATSAGIATFQVR